MKIKYKFLISALIILLLGFIISLLFMRLEYETLPISSNNTILNTLDNVATEFNNSIISNNEIAISNVEENAEKNVVNTNTSAIVNNEKTDIASTSTKTTNIKNKKPVATNNNSSVQESVNVKPQDNKPEENKKIETTKKENAQTETIQKENTIKDTKPVETTKQNTKDEPVGNPNLANTTYRKTNTENISEIISILKDEISKDTELVDFGTKAVAGNKSDAYKNTSPFTYLFVNDIQKGKVKGNYTSFPQRVRNNVGAFGTYYVYAEDEYTYDNRGLNPKWSQTLVWIYVSF